MEWAIFSLYNQKICLQMKNESHIQRKHVAVHRHMGRHHEQHGRIGVLAHHQRSRTDDNYMDLHGAVRLFDRHVRAAARCANPHRVRGDGVPACAHGGVSIKETEPPHVTSLPRTPVNFSESRNSTAFFHDYTGTGRLFYIHLHIVKHLVNKCLC